MGSQDCLVRIEARLQLRYSAVCIPVGARNFLFSKNLQTGSRAHPASCSVGTGAPSLGVKWPGHYVKHSPPFNAKVKNERSYTATPTICLHGVNRENVAFTHSHVCDGLILKDVILLCYL
jgi:hypothetical protein